ncbi:hypothetical protein Tco_0613473 [Tanacetum coccineum]
MVRGAEELGGKGERILQYDSKKTRIKWDAEGDENSKFFHAFMKRRNNKIEKISMKDARWLETPFNKKEVLDAIRGCGGDKAQGADGFNFKFIQKGANEKEPTSWEGVKTQLDTAQEVQNVIHIKAELIQKLRDDQKRMKKVFEDMSGMIKPRSLGDLVGVLVYFKGKVLSGPSDLSGLRSKSNHEFLGVDFEGGISLEYLE